MVGYLLAHRTIERDVYPVDMRNYADAGIKVILRWGWGYADGSGTCPPRQHSAAWVSAMIRTVRASQGVWLHSFFNEYNNPAEWTGGYPSPTEILKPYEVVNLYNMVVNALPSDVLVTLGAIDPFNAVAEQFGQPGDPRAWFEIVHGGAVRVDALLLHCKTQTNNPVECSSEERFADAPLTGRYLHLKTFQNQLEWNRRPDIPVIITELNPQRKNDGSLGWERGNAEWVHAAMSELQAWNDSDVGQPINGVCFYRYDLADAWGLADKSEILGAIREYA